MGNKGTDWRPLSLFVWLMKDETRPIEKNCRPSGKKLVHADTNEMALSIRCSRRTKKLFLLAGLDLKNLLDPNEASPMKSRFKKREISHQRRQRNNQQRARNLEGIRSRFFFTVAKISSKIKAGREIRFLKHRVMLKRDLN